MKNVDDALLWALNEALYTLSHKNDMSDALIADAWDFSMFYGSIQFNNWEEFSELETVGHDPNV